ncbi:MBOAT family O-acyltransferase [Mesorhizobium sp. M0118]|uniref:MBOAT family O-acyltransferase n=1 Tax=Mesorhizobium sp. M0118 TaxID=2956884 RepID=UPI00333D6CE7
MVFNSWPFWIFFSLFIPVYWALPFRGQRLFTLAASYFFYGWWDWRFLPLIAFSTVMDFCLGNLVAAAPAGPPRQRYIWISVFVNLLLLGTFKYYNFFADQLDKALSSLGIAVSLPLLNVILPVGISFYTFQSMSYVFDIARGIAKPASSFWNFALYVSFFPHLVAGPIMRSGAKGHEELGRGLLKQLEVPRVSRPDDFSLGLYYILVGLFKKVVVGDNMASLVNSIFGREADQLTGLECLVGVYAFAWQIYADFSGYSSIAQGLAKWMGIDLMDNFKIPYLAISPSDFWRRWHISLSTWLRDYVYISLGGSRGSTPIVYRNLMITMVLGGIWHGANWTFVLWGLFHGLLLCIYRFMGWEGRAPLSAFGRAWRIVLMFQLVCFGWLLFRAENISQVGTFLHLIATDWRITAGVTAMLGLMVFYTLPLFLFEFWLDRRKKNLLALPQGSWSVRAVVYAYMILMLIFFPSPNAHEFIYFQF